MNKEKIEAVAMSILTNEAFPDVKFDMAEYWTQACEFGGPENDDMIDCETFACIAGHVVIMYGDLAAAMSTVDGYTNGGFYGQATEILELDSQQARELFLPSTFAVAARDAELKDGERVDPLDLPSDPTFDATPREAYNVMMNLIKTNQVDWGFRNQEITI